MTLLIAVEQEIKKEWLPPPRNLYKFNVDASYVLASSIAILGVVVKDKKALVRFSTVTKVEGVVAPLQAEIMAIMFGLQVASEMNYKDILVRCDCWVVIAALSFKLLAEFYYL